MYHSEIGVGREMVGNLISGEMDLGWEKPSSEGLHLAVSQLKPSGFCLKRISIFENPISANLEFSKDKSRRKSIFKLELSVHNDGQTLSYTVPNVSIFSGGGRQFATEIVEVLNRIEPDYG